MKNHKCKVMSSWRITMINTREIAAEYRISHWSQIMQERTASGLSITAYCERSGIHQNVYHYWQRKLCEAAVIASSQSENETTPPTAAPQGWAICETKNLPSQIEETVEIKIGKSSISVTTSTNPELLSNICKLLMELC